MVEFAEVEWVLPWNPVTDETPYEFHESVAYAVAYCAADRATELVPLPDGCTCNNLTVAPAELLVDMTDLWCLVDEVRSGA